MPTDQGTQERCHSIIIGLGNPLLTDDAVGLEVARRVHSLLGSRDVECRELAVGGVELMESIIGYRKAVIIDGVVAEDGEPGTWSLLDLGLCLPDRHATMSHQIGLLEGLDLGLRLGLEMPESVRVYAVSIVDPFTFGTRMTPQVESAIPRVAHEIATEIRAELCGSRSPGEPKEPQLQTSDAREG
jgi:hydrogenase maturation protease